MFDFHKLGLPGSRTIKANPKYAQILSDSLTDCTKLIKIDRFPLKPGCIWEIELYLISKFLKQTYMTSIFIPSYA